MDDFQDPYQAADANAGEAKILAAQPSRGKSRLVIVGVVIVSLILGVVILTGVSGMLSHPAAASNVASKPVTMSKAQGESFAQQQAGQAQFMASSDADKKRQHTEDIVTGNAAGLAGSIPAQPPANACDEAPGVPAMTAAQRQAAGCDGASAQPHGQKSEAQVRLERAQLEAEHRRQNDIDSSPMALDFSDYFDKANTPTAPANPSPVTPADTGIAVGERRAAAVREEAEQNLAEYRKRAAQPKEDAETVSTSTRKEPHDPQQDYVFDSSYGKLYRLMEDSIIECVLVNRLSGASPGPVIVMVTTDVFSHSGAHLLIPKGTRLLGKVSAVASLNQERLFVAFHRAIMPDGYSVSLDKFQGLDVIGQTGLRDLVNHHYVQIFGASLALAAVGAVTQIGNSGAAYGAYDFGVSMRNGASEQLGQSSQRIMERFLNTLPTFTIRERSIVKVMLSGDLLLPDIKNHNMDPDL